MDNKIDSYGDGYVVCGYGHGNGNGGGFGI